VPVIVVSGPLWGRAKIMFIMTLLRRPCSFGSDEIVRFLTGTYNDITYKLLSDPHVIGMRIDM